MSIRIALAGLGEAARSIHIPACRSIPEIEIVGGFDPHQIDAPVHMFSSLDELFRQARPDILIVATPPKTHYAVAAAALENGIHVFCEKPFTHTLDEALELVGLAATQSRRLVVNNEFRYMACHEAAKQAIDRGEIGELQFLELHQTFRVDSQTEAGWRGTEVERTGTEFGIHALDLCRYFFGCEPISMYSRMPKPPDGEGPDLVNLVDLEFPQNRIARITLNRLTKGPHRYLNGRFDGTTGTIETQLGGDIGVRAGIQGGSRRPYFDLQFALGSQAKLFKGVRTHKLRGDGLDLFSQATAKLLRYFIEGLEGDGPIPSEGSDNIKSFELMRSAYEIAANGYFSPLPIRSRE